MRKMWKADLRVEDCCGQTVSKENEGQDLVPLAAWAAKEAREISQNKMMSIEISRESVIYRDGNYIAGYANFWEE